jgi:predicted TIM-barrel fold metal-dependent hydrolase
VCGSIAQSPECWLAHFEIIPAREHLRSQCRRNVHARYGKPLAFHIGADAYEETHPYRLGRIAARFPEIPFLLIHIGGAALPPLDRSAISMAEQYPNITLIGSAVPETAVLRALERLGPERVCFGSDMPFRLMHVRVAIYRALL